MNAQATIKTALDADATLSALLLALPDDPRSNATYLTPIDHEAAADAYMPGTDTLWPSIYISPGDPATIHPQAWKITNLAARYPECWIYAPLLPGVDGRAIVRQATDRVRLLLDEIAVTDEDTGIAGRLGWFGDLPAHWATEFADTVAGGVRMQHRTRWKTED